MTRTPLLSVIIVHYNTPDLIKQAVASVRRDERTLDGAIELLIVDNSKPEFRIHPDEADDVIIPVKNQGYGVALNQGIQRARGSFIILMNGDVHVLPGCLVRLINALHTHRVGAVGPQQVLDGRGTVFLPPLLSTTPLDTVLRSRPLLWPVARKRWLRNARAHWTATHPIESPLLVGSLLATRRDVLDEVGGFDERFFLFFEEADWLRRVQEHGYSTLYEPRARIVHRFHQSVRQRPTAQSHFERSRRLYEAKYPRGAFWRGVDTLLPAGKPVSAATPDTLQRVQLPLDLSPWVTNRRDTIWIHLSQNPSGIPAAASRIDATHSHWPAEPDTLTTLPSGTYWLWVFQGRRVLRRMTCEL
jgi:GT2 family glycosyltransferase